MVFKRKMYACIHMSIHLTMLRMKKKIDFFRF